MDFTLGESVNLDETFELDSEDDFKLGDIFEIEKNDGFNSNRKNLGKKNIITSSILNMSGINHNLKRSQGFGKKKYGK